MGADAFEAERAHRLAEASAGFPLLRGCPNSFALSLLDRIDRLSADDQVSFAGQVSELSRIQATQQLSLTARQDVLRDLPLSARLYDPEAHTVRRPSLRFQPVKRLALLKADPGGIDAFIQLQSLSEDEQAPPRPHIMTLDEAVPVAPAKLRKAVRAALLEAFGGTYTKISGDLDQLVAAIDGGRLTLNLSFAAPGRASRQQMDYSFYLDRAPGDRLMPTSYESLWLLPANWDLLTKSNCDQSVAHLIRVIRARLAVAAP
jgi:hypothetical protein